MSLSSIEHDLILGILLNMHCVKREWHSWSSPWLCKWGILVGSYEWQDSGGGCWVGRHPPILTSEQRAGDLTRRFPLPWGGPCGVPSYFVLVICTIVQTPFMPTCFWTKMYKDNWIRRDLTRRFPHPRGGHRGVPSYFWQVTCTVVQRIAGPNKGPSCQHAYNVQT